MTPPFRRKVLYLPGYDPIPPRRYRELYRREAAAQALISGYRIESATRQDETGFGWAIRGDFDGRETEAEFEVLVWADIVQASMGQSILATYMQLWRTSRAYIGSGALWRLMRLRRGPVITALYPVMVLLIQFLVALSMALLGGWAVGWLIAIVMPPGAVLIAALIAVPITALSVIWLVLASFQRMDNRFFAYYLMHDYAFTAVENGAYPAALEARLRDFASRIRIVLQGDWDEVLVIGHSSGAHLAISVLADLIRAEPIRENGPRLALLTLGHVVPMVSFLPRADRLRRDLRDLAASPALCWIDVTAPGDACCFSLCDPVAVSGVEPKARNGPVVISAAFSQSLSPRQLQALKWRWFRLHFQYLCAFERVRDYDYFAITAGPQTLAKRFSGRGHSPARITRAVNPHPAIMVSP